MRIKEGFVKRTVVGTVVAVPVGENISRFQGMINLHNDTADFIWGMLTEKDCSFEDLLTGVLQEFDVNEDEARADLDEFLAQLRELRVVDE